MQCPGGGPALCIGGLAGVVPGGVAAHRLKHQAVVAHDHTAATQAAMAAAVAAVAAPMTTMAAAVAATMAAIAVQVVAAS